GEISKPDDSACNTQIASVAAFSRKFVTLAHVALPRLLLVHGSVVNGDATWAAQQALSDRFELVVPNRRGFPPGPDVDHVDFEDEAGWLDEFLEPGTHLVGHSYGGVIALLTAARRPDLLRSLTVIEPPCLAVARGNPVVDAYQARSALLWAKTGDPEE